MCVGGSFQRRFRIEFEVEAPRSDEVSETNSRPASLGPDLATGGDEIVGGHIEPLRGQRDERLARGRRGAPDLHAAALNTVRTRCPPLVRRERGVALDISST